MDEGPVGKRRLPVLAKEDVAKDEKDEEEVDEEEEADEDFDVEEFADGRVRGRVTALPQRAIAAGSESIDRARARGYPRAHVDPSRAPLRFGQDGPPRVCEGARTRGE